MPADIEERTKLQILATQHHYAVTPNVGSHEIADTRDIIHVSNELPAPQEQGFVFEIECFCVGISPARKRAARACAGINGLNLQRLILQWSYPIVFAMSLYSRSEEDEV